MIVQQNSDDDNNEDVEASNPNSTISQGNILVEVLREKIVDVANVLRDDHDGEKMKGSVSNEDFVPLGQQRLRTVELVLKMVQMKKELLY